MNWDDPSERAALIEKIGPEAYNEAMRKHREESVISTIGGHAIRPVGSRFGRLYMVGDTGTAYPTQEKAEQHARDNALPGYEAPIDPKVVMVAAEFGRVLREWLSPKKMRLAIAKNREYGPGSKICASHDYCDANMAMNEAMESLDIAVFDKEGSISDQATDIWNAAWDIAKANEFRRTLTQTDFGTYAFAKDGVCITGFLNNENSIETYDPASGDESIPEGYGFDVLETGGGCTAWHQDFLLEGKKVHMLITDVSGTTHKIYPADNLLIGVYSDDDGCAQNEILLWEQANFPLDAESNMPDIVSRRDVLTPTENSRA